MTANNATFRSNGNQMTHKLATICDCKAFDNAQNLYCNYKL